MILRKKNDPDAPDVPGDEETNHRGEVAGHRAENGERRPETNGGSG